MSFSWLKIINENINKLETPCYIFCPEPIKDSIDFITNIKSTIPIRNWLSLKTQPIKQLLHYWKNRGEGIEVVSYYEFLAALNEGFSVQNILINGVAKHEWLVNTQYQGLKVHFDSFKEISSLSLIAKVNDWQVGLRIQVRVECDPDDPKFKGQFGFVPCDLELAINELYEHKLSIDSIHFHINSDIKDAELYSAAINEVIDLSNKFNLNIKYLDCGGGLPTYFMENDKYISQKGFNFNRYSQIIKEIPLKIPSIKEIWLENGRFMTSRAAILLIKILDIKDRPDCRYLICDGGRTNHALVSDWESHNIGCYPAKNGEKIFSTICGPTCMAYDHLVRTDVPSDINIGDYIIWYDAGAYHIPWETRFSKGYANVYWYDKNKIGLIRNRESFKHWWDQWLLV